MPADTPLWAVPGVRQLGIGSALRQRIPPSDDLEKGITTVLYPCGSRLPSGPSLSTEQEVSRVVTAVRCVQYKQHPSAESRAGFSQDVFCSGFVIRVLEQLGLWVLPRLCQS